MSRMPQLPAGLDPVQAGRFGLWLLGKRSHARALRRTFSGTRVPSTRITGRLLGILLPWTIHEYPGNLQALAEMCGVARSTASDWLYCARPLPRKHAARLADICEQREIAFRDLKEEFRAIAAAPAERPLKRRSRGG
jgi:hypothetical protein